MPGIKVGDLGAKFGFNYTDNGWLSFDNVRIPREDILSRFIEVTKEGVVTLKGDPRMNQQIMIKTRLALIFLTAINII